MMRMVNKKCNKLNVGILSSIMTKPNLGPFSNLIKLIIPLSDNLTVIKVSGEKLDINISNGVNLVEIDHKKGNNPPTQIFNYIWSQLKISYNLIASSRDLNLWIFYLGISLVLPAIVARLMGKKIILIVGAAPDDIRSHHWISRVLRAISLKLVDCIVLYSKELIKKWQLEEYNNKIFITYEHFLDFNKFKRLKKIDERGDIIGYVGRLSNEKGILNFIKAINLLENNNLKFLIYGEGELIDEIKEYLKENNICNVDLKGWVPNDQMFIHLNDLKLIVLPSFTEGLPNIMLESMACGTPVLATPVGAIPDVIKDKYNGFIMKDNSPEVIVENIRRAITSSDLEKIAENGYNTVKMNFSYENTLEKWETILNTKFRRY